MARIAVTVVSDEGLSSKVNEHFGMSEYFAILDAEGDRITSVKIAHFVSDDEKKIDDLLIKKGVGVVLTGRIGSCYIKKLLDNGIKIYQGAEGTVEDAVEAYNAEKLTEIVTAGYAL